MPRAYNSWFLIRTIRSLSNHDVTLSFLAAFLVAVTVWNALRHRYKRTFSMDLTISQIPVLILDTRLACTVRYLLSRFTLVTCFLVENLTYYELNISLVTQYVELCALLLKIILYIVTKPMKFIKLPDVPSFFFF